MKYKLLSTLFLIGIGVAFFLLNFYTPIMHDDIAYLFKYGPSGTIRPTEIPVQSFSDILESQYYHYLDVNGRAPLQFLIQLFLFFGEQIFNVFNTGAFIALILMVYQLSVTKKITKIQQWLVIIFITACIWLTSPFIGQTLLWLTGAINYLWGTLTALVFLWYLQKEKSTESLVWWQYVGLFLGASLAGFTQESLTLGVSASLGVYYLVNYSKINKTTMLLVVGFWIGTLLIILSPGTFHRIDSEIEIQQLGLLEHVFVKLLNLIPVMNALKMSLIVYMPLLIIAMYFKMIEIRSYLKQQALFLLTILFTCLLFVVIGKAESRMFFGISILFVILSTQLAVLLLSKINLKLSKTITIVLIVFLLSSFYMAFNDCKTFHVVFKDTMESIKTSKNGIVRVPEIPPSSYVYNTLSGIKDINNYHTRVMGLQLKVPSITLLPKEVHTALLPNNTICTEKNKDTSWSSPIYCALNFNYLVVVLDALQLDKCVKPTVVFTNKLVTTSHLKAYQVFVRGLLGTLPKKKEIGQAFVVILDSKLFVLIDKNSINLNNVNKIEISNELENGKLILEINKNELP